MLPVLCTVSAWSYSMLALSVGTVAGVPMAWCGLVIVWDCEPTDFDGVHVLARAESRAFAKAPKFKVVIVSLPSTLGLGSGK